MVYCPNDPTLELCDMNSIAIIENFLSNFFS